jgi:hypothetical protein
MRHKFFLAAAAVLFVLAILLAALSIRALTAGDKWFVQHVVPNKGFSVSHIDITPTELAITNNSRPEFPGTTADQLAWEVDAAGWQFGHSRTPDDIFFPSLRGQGRAGFAWYRHDTLFGDRTGKVVGAETARALLIPLWALFTGAIALPAIVVGRFLIRRRIVLRRQRRGQCVRCGYDIRSTPDRCSECGSVPKKL